MLVDEVYEALMVRLQIVECFVDVDLQLDLIEGWRWLEGGEVCGRISEYIV